MSATAEQLAAMGQIRRWREDALAFVREGLRVDRVDDWQAEVLKATKDHQRIALKASKGPGKSTVLAWLCWWFLCTRQYPKIVATSISGDNLKDGLWTELSKWQQRSPLLKAAFTWSAERVVAKDSPETWFASARAWSKTADQGQQSNTLAGVHADNVMFLVDEAGGIPSAVVAAAEAGLANADPAKGTEAYLILAGNPTQTSGPLYDACGKNRAQWWVKEISGDPDDPARAPRVSIAWAREQIAMHGRDHPYVLVNVFGQFPPSQSNALLGVEDVTTAARRLISPREYANEVKVLGVDVARFGDDRTVLTLRQGRVAFKQKWFREMDTQTVASQVAMVIDEQKPDATFIDADGVGGGVVDRLVSLGYSPVGVHAAGKPVNRKFLNLRVEMWSAMADWIRAGGCIPDDGELISEMTGPTYEFHASGRIKLESKDDLKKRGLASPDKADSLALTFAHPVAHREVRDDLRRRASAVHEYNPYEVGR